MRTALLALPLALAAPLRRPTRPTPAPVLVPRNAPPVEGKYVVRMKASGEATAKAVSAIAAAADYTYSRSFNGFAASLTPQEVEELQGNPDVDYIEQDSVLRLLGTQSDASWNLARLSSANPGGTTYTFDDSAGEGSCAYVIDTGIKADHPEFEGRAQVVANFVDEDNTDLEGHGTHVAGIIGSKTFGVAKKTQLFGIKVFSPGRAATTAETIAAMDFVAQDAASRSCPRGVVVNMSIGRTFSDALNAAAAKMVSDGLFVAVAAGNDRQGAENDSPASEPSVCTVGATGIDDSLVISSNTGRLVDVLAPGGDIVSTWIDGGTNNMTGTSMATPHVAGLAAYLLGMGESAEGMCERLKERALKGVVQGVPGDTDNLLVNNGNLDGGGPAPTPDVDPGNVGPGNVGPGNSDPGNSDPGNVGPGNVDPGQRGSGQRGSGRRHYFSWRREFSRFSRRRGLTERRGFQADSSEAG